VYIKWGEILSKGLSPMTKETDILSKSRKMEEKVINNSPSLHPKDQLVYLW
jgi:hypothetical protein